MKRKSQLRRYTRINPVSVRRRARSGKPGKLGIVRLYGDDLTALRRQCFERDEYRCVDCGCLVAWDEEEATERGIPVGDMAHIKGKRNHGDTLGNVRTKCRRCHDREHRPKTVPSKSSDFKKFRRAA